MSFNPFSNLPLKIGAVLLAFLLWVHVATNQTYEHIFEIPFSFTNVPDGLLLTSKTPEHISIKVRGTGKQLFGLMTDDMVYHYDLADYKAGAQVVEMSSAEVIDILSGSYEEVELLMPKRVQVRLERSVSRDLPVIAEVEVSPADGYVIMGELKVAPATIKVSGPESVMKKLNHLETEPQSIGGVVESFVAELALQIPDSLHLSVADSSVKVSIQVEPRDEQQFDGITVNPPERFNGKRYQFTPATLNLAIGIPRSLAGSVQASDIGVSFKIPESPEDSTLVPILYSLPDRVDVIRSSADSVLILRKS